MHRNSICFLLAAVACTVLPTHAATPAGTITRESMVTSEILNKLSVGADVTFMDRGFDARGMKDDLEARIYGVYIGYDILPWITVFGTVGGCQIKQDETYWSSGAKWSLGVAPNIWEGDLRRPAFLAGKISLTAMGEISMYESSQGDAKADWKEFAAALLIRYEIFEDAPWSADSVTSLRFSIGPVVSKANGDMRDNESKWSFSADKTLGWMATAEWFVAPMFSISGGVESFDSTSVSGSIRLHF